MELRLDTFKEIGDQYKIGNDRTVRSVCVRTRRALSEDKDLAKKMKKMKDLIQKSQEWT